MEPGSLLEILLLWWHSSSLYQEQDRWEYQLLLHYITDPMFDSVIFNFDMQEELKTIIQKHVIIHDIP